MTEIARALFRRALPQLTEAQRSQLLIHWELMIRWNVRVNLTTITRLDAAVWKHYADSVAVLPLIRPGSLVDMGSGAGFPGLPIAVAKPDCTVTLVEPRRKRVSFLRAAVGAMGLENVQVRATRSDDPSPTRADTLVTRATFSNHNEILSCQRWLRPAGRLIAWVATPDRAIPGWRIESYEVGAKRRSLIVHDRPSDA